MTEVLGTISERLRPARAPPPATSAIPDPTLEVVHSDNSINDLLFDHIPHTTALALASMYVTMYLAAKGLVLLAIWAAAPSHQ